MITMSETIKDTFIGVVTHKLFDDSHLGDDYKVIKVGNSVDDETADSLGWAKDNTGINIANKNPYYCELTAQYWMYKNLEEQYKYLGLVHYRRMFFDYSLKSKEYYEDYLSNPALREYLNKYKVIMYYETSKTRGKGRLFHDKDKEDQDINWVIIENIIREKYPEYIDSFNRILYGDYVVFSNMFVTTRKEFIRYSEWLFDVLNQYDDQMKLRGLDRVSRVDGFLSEYLLSVYFYKHFSKKEILRLEIRNIEQDKFFDYSTNPFGRIIHMARCSRGLVSITHKVWAWIKLKR